MAPANEPRLGPPSGRYSSIIMRYPPAVQSFTYRAFTLEEMCSELADVPVESVELCHEHVTPDAGPDAVESVVTTLEESDLSACGYGVVELDDPEDVDPALDLVAALGGEYLACSFDPGDEAVAEALVAGGDERDVDVAIHNHGPEGTYETVADVTTTLERYPNPRLGACVDTGHFLRAGAEPGEAIPALADRLHALHFTDHAAGEGEVVPGRGMVAVADLLDLLDAHTAFDRPIVIEYEADAEDPTPAVQEAVRALADAQSADAD